MYNFPDSIYPLNRKSSYFDQSRAYIVQIILNFHKEILVPHAYFVWQSIEHMPKVKVNTIKNIKTTVWAITFEPEVVESRRDFWLDIKCYWWKHLAELSGSHDAFCVTHVTSNKT